MTPYLGLTTENQRCEDRTGFPIVVGARVHIGPRPTLLSSVLHSGFTGEVLSTERHSKHGWILEVRDEGNLAKRTVRAIYARVQAHSETPEQRDDRLVEARRKRRCRNA